MTAPKHKRCKAKNPEKCKYHHPEAFSSSSVISRKPSVQTQTSTGWRELEVLITKTLEKILPDSYEVQNVGQSNSTFPDVLVKRPNSDTVRIEVKKLPSVAGLQTVIEKTENAYVSTQNRPYTSTILNLLNKYDAEKYVNKLVLLTGEDAEQAFKALELKYAESKVDLLVGTEGEKILVTQTSATKLSEIFNVNLIVRRKKSGSASAPQRLYGSIREQLGEKNLTVKDNKLFLRNLEEITEAKAILETVENRLYINDLGEIRKLGVTNNLTALLSFEARPNLEKKNYKTVEQFAHLVMEGSLAP